MQIVSGTEMRTIDDMTINQYGFEEFALMESAGRAFTEALCQRITRQDRILVFIGGGNNGGDAVICARHLLERGYDVIPLLVVEDTHFKGAAKKHLELFRDFGHEVLHLSSLQVEKSKTIVDQTDVIVDGMLGTGVKGAVREPVATMVSLVNQAKACVFSLDIPSGMPADEAAPEGFGVKADMTITLSNPKETFYLPKYRLYTGKIITVDIGIPAKAQQTITPGKFLITPESVRNNLPVRGPDFHKGKAGRGLLIAGSQVMPGAAALSGEAALRSGAGLLTLGIQAGVTLPLPGACREYMYRLLQVDDGKLECIPLQGYDAVAVGPGLGRDHAIQWEKQFNGYAGTVVVDADGLHQLKGHITKFPLQTKGPVVLTPHPGEMAMLLDCSKEEVEGHRFEKARELAAMGYYVVLKGKNTIIANPDGSLWVNTSGSPALSKGGTGDVLTGMILGMILQGIGLVHALKAAVYIHGACGERTEHVQEAMAVTAGDVINEIGPVIRHLKLMPGPLPVDIEWETVIIE
ncbi:bifunctional ADP-dependent NAD(P)H-hydrate dehydratase/NAD(P)H-hydrate epimerase [Salisediminibacterium beveridgei]|uniref:Bifunctional NAD(P)H-hydrate repair enzyme n=1 Tax=Salisediminibacterium beveridgei TaxID=632773 RepID=A0A1D7QYQ9_9BACI|nr:bifunctional ADP-dependent NAD(P)H-hydrate dehydratase/NAD(P)H-hydrate epimerase [Salisediminibacterium beveridgei]AOM84139.1 NAD(P)HX epimerase / NAD(P)HX dehydratase [Salisediminibacterium beveridgei]